MSGDVAAGVGQFLKGLVLKEHARRRDQISQRLFDDPQNDALKEQARQQEANRVALRENRL